MPGTPAGSQPADGFVSRAELIGLQFVVAAVLQEQQAERLLRDLTERPRRGHEHTKRPERDHAADRPRVLPHRMPRGDVADLVAEHAGQFGLVVEKRQDAARDVDESARQCERVDRRLIDDGELPRKGGPLRELREHAGQCR